MVVFGPVPSGPLGRSLGVNDIPPKVCSYSCVNCQLGRTVKMRIQGQAPRGKSFEKTVLRSSPPVLLDFWSLGCAPYLIKGNTGETGQGTRGPPAGEQLQCDRVPPHARPVRHHGHPHPGHSQGWQRGGGRGGRVSKQVLKGKQEAVLWPQNREGTQ